MATALDYIESIEDAARQIRFTADEIPEHILKELKGIDETMWSIADYIDELVAKLEARG